MNVIRKKKNYIVCMVFWAILMIGIPTGAYAKDYSDNHTYPDDTLEEIIEVRAEDDSYDQQLAQNMIDNLDRIPKRIRSEALRENEVDIIFTDSHIVDLDEFKGLKGKTMDNNIETKYDDLLGITSRLGGEFISAAEITFIEGAGLIEIHEFAHVIDQTLLGRAGFIEEGKIVSKLDEFQSIFKEEQPDFLPDPYYENEMEYFAESLAVYYTGQEYRDIMQEYAPKTYQFIDQLEQRTLKMAFTDEQTVKIDWKKVEGADAYEVYRDDEKIDTVKDNEYEDEKIATSYEEEPEYVVKAINGSDILQVSLPNSILIETSGDFDDSFLEAEDETEDNSPQTSIDPPENLEYAYTTDDTIVLTWDSVPEAEQYRITKNGVEIATTKNEKYEDNDYQDEYITSYIYSVTAVGEDTESEPSEEVMFESEQKKFLLGEILSNMGSFCGWLFS